MNQQVCQTDKNVGLNEWEKIKRENVTNRKHGLD